LAQELIDLHARSPPVQAATCHARMYNVPITINLNTAKMEGSNLLVFLNHSWLYRLSTDHPLQTYR
jgi:hypothetical protein